MNKQLSLIFIIILSFSTIINAQNLTSSPYSRYGVGDLQFQGFGRSSAMGNTAIGSQTPFHINKVNPASYSAFYKYTFILEVGVGHRTTLYETQDNEQYTHNSNLNYFAAGFRLRNWWGTSFGIVPLSGVGYNMLTTDSLYTDDGYAGFTNEYKGKGGINQLYWGNSFTFYEKIAIGANIQYLFGSIDRNTSSKISETSFSSSLYSYSRSIVKGFNYNLGIQYSDTIKCRKDSTKNALTFTLGGTFENKSNLKSNNTLFKYRILNAYGNGHVDTLINDTVSTSKLTLPTSFGLGFSVTLYDKFTINADYTMQNWKGLNVLNQDQTFFNSNSFAFGMEYCTAQLSPVYWKTIRYRVGAYYTNTYLNINNQQINDYGLTFGLGIPVKFNSTQINASFQLGTRGTIENDLLKESYIAVKLNFSLYDIWFRKFQFY